MPDNAMRIELDPQLRDAVCSFLDHLTDVLVELEALLESARKEREEK